MTAWRFKAVDGKGRAFDGEMDAPDEAAVLAHIRRDGAMPLAVTPARGGWIGGLSWSLGRGDALTRQDVTNITRELSTMLGAGQDLDHALRFLVETAPNRRTGRVLVALRDDVRNGNSLAAAMAKRSGSFSRLYVGLVRAGEAGGTLPATLEQLADLLERERSLAATIQSALIYPALLLIAACGAVVLLLTQVLPEFVPLFEQSGVALPASTQFLIDTGNFVSRYGLIVLLVLLLLLLLFRVTLRQPGPRLAFDRFKLQLPIVGGLLREVMAARLARTLGSLLVNRVSLITALGITREVLGNEAGVAAMDHAIPLAKAGAGLSTPLGDSGLFPARLIHLLRLGEETAQHGPMALRAAAIHEERVRVVTERLVSLLTPAITIIMGALIAGIVSSLLLAMLSLNDLAR
ncbi:MAG: type II secretion system F family protein [Acetobacteraceae bacterium]|jgi:general secretion pathway protein F